MAIILAAIVVVIFVGLAIGLILMDRKLAREEVSLFPPCWCSHVHMPMDAYDQNGNPMIVVQRECWVPSCPCLTYQPNEDDDESDG